MRSIAVVILLLSSVLLAETQEAAYFRALKAEEAGDITLALESFEEAAALPGPYTEEIREIVKEYYKALGVSEDSADNPWSFRFLGNLGFYGLRYSEFGGVDEVTEHGGDLFLSLTPFLDYTTGDYIHSFGIGFNSDWFLANENMPALDTNDWKFSLGLEYSLVGSSFLLDIGVDLNFAQGEDVSPSFFGWIEKDFFRIEKNRLGMAAWGYYDADGPLAFALYGAWHRTSTYGWNAAVYVGGRFEADSAVDYVGYLAAYEAALQDAFNEAAHYEREPFEGGGAERWDNRGARNPMDACLETYGEECFEWEISKIDSIYWSTHSRPDSSSANSLDSATDVSVAVPKYYAKWLGPTLRSRLSYKFRNGLSLEARLNLFYGFVLDGPDSDYEKIRKFSGSWGGTVFWKPNSLTLYLGLEQFYKHYGLPAYYKGIYPQNTLLSELKAGLKWEL
ncbi:hypothetical protein [Fibrobacter sp. UWH4]|uniref:hypothetical protein n=1 Tax=Fibrobacter sp. UWH4 TaxID=1896210 RepID=UPI00091671C6|nr:hypothetical protein [Fibrobacter sp. UWH4]SHK29029.1 hypothetical protein SAMN05720762_101278 [Fibrobacter sp. UWH4]